MKDYCHTQLVAERQHYFPEVSVISFLVVLNVAGAEETHVSLPRGTLDEKKMIGAEKKKRCRDSGD